MDDLTVRRGPLHWWAAGLLLGLVQVLAVGLKKPLGVSTQFVVADAKMVSAVAPDYAETHPLISKEKYQKFGYGWWLDVGLVIGAFSATIVIRRWKLQATTVWWRQNHGASILTRLIAGFCGGFLILLGARFAHGCTSGQFASGWAQLSLSVIPFTVTLFGFGMLTAYLVCPKTPVVDK
ncbi:MAG: YeeE/YedE family protein [Phycisphaerales bacterium]|nr:MAG: YeeE/YedE family protein [Phycisphaerales bacterium]